MEVCTATIVVLFLLFDEAKII